MEFFRVRLVIILSFVLLSPQLSVASTFWDAVGQPTADAYKQALQEGNFDKAAELLKLLQAIDLHGSSGSVATPKKEKNEAVTNRKITGGDPPPNVNFCAEDGEVEKANCSKRLAEKSPEIESTTTKMIEEAEKGNVKEVKRLNSVLDRIVTESVPRDVGWGAEGDDFFLGLYAGLEGSSVEGLKEEGTLRAGITAYDQLIRFQPREFNRQDKYIEAHKFRKESPFNPLRRDCQYRAFTEKEKTAYQASELAGTLQSADSFLVRRKESVCGWGFGLHGWMSAFLTSSAEQSKDQIDVASMPPPDSNEIQSAFETELGIFVPIFQKAPGKFFQNMLIGPTIQGSLRKLDDADSFSKRYYLGSRFSYSPETFLDILWGKTEGVRGKRVEVKAQVPVANLTENSRLFLGGAVNFGVSDSKDESDSVRLFLTWNTNVDDIFRN